MSGHRASRSWLIVPAMILGGCILGSDPASDPIPDHADAQNTDATTILERVGRAYAESDRYRDRGQARWTAPDRAEPVRYPFQTSFAVEDDEPRLRYEFWVPRTNRPGQWHHYVLWSGPDEVERWSSLGGADTHESLGRALRVVEGVSHRLSVRVPAWLLSLDLGAGERIRPETAKLEGRESFEDHEAFRIRGTTAGKDPVVLWIDTETFLIRQIEQSLGGGETFAIRFEPDPEAAVDRDEIEREPDRSGGPPPRDLLDVWPLDDEDDAANPSGTPAGAGTGTGAGGQARAPRITNATPAPPGGR